MNAGIESTFANHSLIKQLLEPFRLLSRHTPRMERHSNTAYYSLATGFRPGPPIPQRNEWIDLEQS